MRPGERSATPEASSGGELEAIALLAARFATAVPGEIWIGDDTAVVCTPGGEQLLFAADCVVEGVHFELGLSSLADVGWKVMAANVSDVASMGGHPFRAVATIVGASVAECEALSEGVAEAAEAYACPLVGGDLSAGEVLVVTVAVLGTTGGRPVLRSGARAGDLLYVTGPLGSSSAGLAMLRADPSASGRLVDAHRRPRARLAEGIAAAGGGASAMIDISDGLGLDLDRLAIASGVGVVLDEVPVAAGASLQDALAGGEDYELVFAAPDAFSVVSAFEGAGLEPPIPIGRCVRDASVRRLGERALPTGGFEHRLGPPRRTGRNRAG